MIDLDLKYKVVFVSCITASREFFTGRVGFREQEVLLIDGKDCPVLQMYDSSFLMLVEKEQREADMIIIYTEDCLRDYHWLRQKEVAGLGQPVYLPEGLSIEFQDPSGNRFMLLEKRDYSDA